MSITTFPMTDASTQQLLYDFGFVHIGVTLFADFPEILYAYWVFFHSCYFPEVQFRVLE